MIFSTLIFATAPLLVAPTAPWQEPAPPAASEAAAPVGTASTVHARLRTELAEAEARQQAAFVELRETDEWTKAEAANDNSALNALYGALPGPDHDAFARRALDAASRFDGDAGQALLFGFAVEWSSDPEVTAAGFGGLVDKHPSHEALFGATLRLAYRARSMGEETFKSLVDRILAGDAPPATKANALHARMSVLVRSVRRGTALSAEQQVVHDADRARILEIAPDSIAAYRVQAERFEAERLQIGMTAPNIVGTDLFGEALSLEQFRGKVVVLDFWGDW